MKTRDRLWSVYLYVYKCILVYLNTIEQQPKNIVMIGKYWNNQYCYC